MAEDYALNHTLGCNKNQTTSSAFRRLGQVKSPFRGSQIDHELPSCFQEKAKVTSSSRPEKTKGGIE